MCFLPAPVQFWQLGGEIDPAGAYASGKGRRLRRLTMRNHLRKPEVSPGVCHGERRLTTVLSACFSPIFCNFGSWGRNRPCGRYCAPRRSPTAPPDHAKAPLHARGKPWWMQWGAQASGGAFCL